jgi:hypothetical protein
MPNEPVLDPMIFNGIVVVLVLTVCGIVAYLAFKDPSSPKLFLLVISLIVAFLLLTDKIDSNSVVRGISALNSAKIAPKFTKNQEKMIATEEEPK